MLRGERVSAEFFETLGVPMYLGRSFRPEEDAPGARDVLILSYAVWRDRFGSDPTVVGRTIPATAGAFTVVGVLPADFQPLHMSNPAELPQIFAPLGYDTSQRECRSCRDLRVIGRLGPGVTSGAAQAELAVTMRALVREHPGDYPAGAVGSSHSASRTARRPLWRRALGTAGRRGTPAFAGVRKRGHAAAGEDERPTDRNGRACSAGRRARAHHAADADRVPPACGVRRCRGRLRRMVGDRDRRAAWRHDDSADRRARARRVRAAVRRRCQPGDGRRVRTGADGCLAARPARRGIARRSGHCLAAASGRPDARRSGDRARLRARARCWRAGPKLSATDASRPRL